MKELQSALPGLRQRVIGTDLEWDGEWFPQGVRHS